MTTVSADASAQHKKIVSIQALRGIAAFLVVLVHCFPHQYYSNTNILKIIASKGHVGVQIFFIISGYIVPYSMYNSGYNIKKIGVFFAKRMVRIEPPYIASILLILVLSWMSVLSPWSDIKTLYKPDWWNILGHLCYLNAFTKQPWLSTVYWTLALEFMFYIMLALFFSFITSSRKPVLMVSFFILLALSFSSDSLSFYLLQHHTVFFMLGIALFLFHIGKINVKEYFLLTASCFLVCMYIFSPLYTFVALSSLLFIQYVKRIPNFLLWLGTISYSLYLTHVVIAGRVEALFVRFIPNLPISIKYTLGILGCIVFGAIYYYIIERPFQKISRNFGHKKA